MAEDPKTTDSGYKLAWSGRDDALDICDESFQFHTKVNQYAYIRGTSNYRTVPGKKCVSTGEKPLSKFAS